MKIFTNFMSELLEKTIRRDSELTHKPISIFCDYRIRDIEELKENPYNFLLIMEPNELFGYHDWAIKYNNYFDLILTWSQPILDSCPDNSIFFPFGFRTVELDYTIYQNNKNFEVSFLCGNKQMIEGHVLRHKIFQLQKEIKIPNHFIYTAPWDGGKSRCWESMFHIAVENSKNTGYFTEKIIDAFLTKTIPIYWGCPNINEFFNKDGIITFNTESELVEIINNLTPEYYNSKKDSIEENYKKAIEISDFMGRLNNLIKDICDINNIV